MWGSKINEYQVRYNKDKSREEYVKFIFNYKIPY